MCVCLFVCLFVPPNKEKYWANLQNSFFPAKLWTARVTWAILEVSPTTPSCRIPQKPSKNRRKTGFSDFHECIAKSSCTISTKIGSMVQKIYSLLNMKKKLNSPTNAELQ